MISEDDSESYLIPQGMQLKPKDTDKDKNVGSLEVIFPHPHSFTSLISSSGMKVMLTEKEKH